VNNVLASLENLGYFHIEPLPKQQDRWTLNDQNGRHGHLAMIPAQSSITSGMLTLLDQDLANYQLEFVVIIHEITDPLLRERLETWDFSCEATVVCVDELTRTADDSADEQGPPENISDLLKKPGESYLSLLNRIRPRLLDLTLRNPLLNFRGGRGNTIPIVDELPRLVVQVLGNGKSMRLDPASASTPQATIMIGKISEPEQAQMRLTVHADEATLSMPSTTISATPSFELPVDSGESVAARHRDLALQTPLIRTTLSARLGSMLRDQETAIESTGTNPLHLALGFLHWFESPEETKDRLAPLLLIPVSATRTEVTISVPLRKGDEGWDPKGPALQKQNVREFEYSVAMTGEEVVTNECLMRKMSADFNLVIPRLNANTDEGEAVDPEEYFLRVAAAIARLPTDKRWKVRREISLGFFSFVKLLEWQDLDPAHWKVDPNGLLERLLSGQDSVPRNWPPEDEMADEFHLSDPMPVVHEADSSQTAVLARANAGEDLVVQGPPGTGKTQTITNLIASAIGAGKRVLFVAEKMAALNAAREKLESAGLSEFCLELHSHKATPAAALKALNARLERPNHPTINLEARRRTVRANRDALNAYATAVATPVGHHGERLDEILWRCDVANAELITCLTDQAEVPRLQAPADQILPAAKYAECVHVLASVAELATESIPRLSRPWNDFRPTRFLGSDDAVVLTYVSRLIDHLRLLTPLEQQYPDYPGWMIPLSAWQPHITAITALRDPPAQLLPSVARSLLTSDHLIVQRAIDRIQLLRKFRLDSKLLLDQLPENGDYQRIAQVLADLSTRGLHLATHEQLKQRLIALEHLDERIAAVHTGLPSVLTALTLVGDIKWHHLSVIQHLMQILGSVDGLSLLHTRLLRGFTRSTIASGQKTSDELVELRTKLDRIFVLDDLPVDDELKQLRHTLRAKPHAVLAFFGIGPLAKARRRLRGFVRNHTAGLDVPILLDQVLNLRKRETAFREDHALAHEIGPSFAGCQTPWPRLAHVSDFIQNLTSVYGIDSVRTCLEKLPSLRDPAPNYAALENALSALVSLKDNPVELWSFLSVGVRAPTATISSLHAEIQAMIVTIREALTFISERGTSPLATATVQKIEAAVTEVTSIRLLAETAASDPDAKRALGPIYAGPDTLLEPIVESLEWARVVQQARLGKIGNWILSDHTSSRLTSARSIAAISTPALTNCIKVSNDLTAYGQVIEGGAFDVAHSTSLPGDLIPALDAAMAASEHLRGWSRWCPLKSTGSALGLTSLITAVESGLLTPAGLSVALDADVFGRLARHALKQNPALRDFDRSSFDTLREKFRDDDRSLIRYGRSHISQSVMSTPIPQGVAGTRVAELTDLRLIQNEIPKKRQLVPIRQLIKRAMPAIQALTPCLMMSPLSVAQFLPRVRGMFDLVIMDEASQIRPEDAFGALLRAKQAIIVGDEKQMPPSNEFRGNGATNDGLGLLAGNAVSILELAHVALPRGRACLKWHYRSQHESLIQFSNARYYENKLVIFPSKHSAGPDVGVHWVHVPEGRFLAGLNRVEAKAVVKAVVDHAIRMLPRKPEQRESLLVVTMNSEQNKLVNELIDTMALNYPQISLALQGLRDLPERLMIKNLENVQGDERDRVIIGFTYGKDPQSGKIRQNFGPINQSGGERRLNVLFSRAKRSITVISSMLSEHIIPGSGSARGVHDLKDYLAFAATGGIPDRGVITRREPDSDFELAVGAVISRLGYTPVYQVGVANYFIDIGIIDPRSQQEYLLGIECDGATYHSSRCARDRDRLRQDIIESRGWKIHRIWSTSWFRDRLSEERRLQQAIQAALKGK
jgi:very-short-patch-repair endonuclease